jgi:hypothetical protein
LKERGGQEKGGRGKDVTKEERGTSGGRRKKKKENAKNEV